MIDFAIIEPMELPSRAMSKSKFQNVEREFIGKKKSVLTHRVRRVRPSYDRYESLDSGGKTIALLM